MRDVALLGTRLVVGSYLAVHGAQKLFGGSGQRGRPGRIRRAAQHAIRRPSIGLLKGALYVRLAFAAYS